MGEAEDEYHGKPCTTGGYDPDVADHRRKEMTLRTNELTEEVTLPSDLAFVLATNRPALLKTFTRPLDDGEVRLVLNAMAVLMETNGSLQERISQMEIKIATALSASRGLSNQLASLMGHEVEEEEK